MIDVAPLEIAEPAAEDDFDSSLIEYVGEISSKLEAAEAELIQLKTKKSIDQVRADMLEGYSNRVFWFVVWYCIVVGVLLIGSGFEHTTRFHLSDAILGIIAGSTAVAVIGLIGMVITGLFGGRVQADARKRNSKAQKGA